MGREQLGEIPLNITLAIETLKGGEVDGEERKRLQQILDEWVNGNELKEIHIQAQLEPDRGDSEMRRTRPETPTTTSRNEILRSPRVDQN